MNTRTATRTATWTDGSPLLLIRTRPSARMPRGRPHGSEAFVWEAPAGDEHKGAAVSFWPLPPELASGEVLMLELRGDPTGMKLDSLVGSARLPLHELVAAHPQVRCVGAPGWLVGGCPALRLREDGAGRRAAPSVQQGAPPRSLPWYAVKRAWCLRAVPAVRPCAHAPCAYHLSPPLAAAAGGGGGGGDGAAAGGRPPRLQRV